MGVKVEEFRLTKYKIPVSKSVITTNIVEVDAGSLLEAQEMIKDQLGAIRTGRQKRLKGIIMTSVETTPWLLR